MPERKKRVPAEENQKQPTKTLTQEQVDEIVFPELSKDKFTIGGKEFRIRVLPYKFEQMFRRSVLPIIAAEMKPIEKAIFIIKNDEAMYSKDLQVTESIASSETNADIYLLNAIVVICMSQDERWLESAAKGKEISLKEQNAIESEYRLLIEYCNDWPSVSPRHYMREVVRRQQEKLDMVQLLGESLMARLAEVASLVGGKSEFDSLKRDFTLQVRNFLEKVGKVAGASANSSTPSMETGSETNQTETPSKSSEASPPAELAAAPAEEPVEESAQVQ